jgi:hypothetical protein
VAGDLSDDDTTSEALRAHVIEAYQLAVDTAETMAGIVGRGDPKDWACDFSTMEGVPAPDLTEPAANDNRTQPAPRVPHAAAAGRAARAGALLP